MFTPQRPEISGVPHHGIGHLLRLLRRDQVLRPKRNSSGSACKLLWQPLPHQGQPIGRCNTPEFNSRKFLRTMLSSPRARNWGPSRVPCASNTSSDLPSSAPWLGCSGVSTGRSCGSFPTQPAPEISNIREIFRIFERRARVRVSGAAARLPDRERPMQ